MLRTRTGYAGGLAARPAYRDMADHTETVEIVFDPSKISYARLLDEFWRGHEPSSPGGARQYRSVILFGSEAQRLAAESSGQAEAARRGRHPGAAIEPLQRFWPAEEYHQKYYLQMDKALLREMAAAWPGQGGWLLTTASARLNAYAAGALDRKSLAAELEKTGAPESLIKRLR